MNRTEIIAQLSATVMAGFLANPNVVAHNAQTGWEPVNCTFDSLERKCVSIASNLLRGAETPEGTEEGEACLSCVVCDTVVKSGDQHHVPWLTIEGDVWCYRCAEGIDEPSL